MAVIRNAARGEEFRDDLRPLAATSGDTTRPGAGNAAARRALTPAELAELTALNDWRSRASLLLAQDLTGINSWKTFAYFFGAPAINAETNRAARPLDDTSPALRASARSDRWAVLGFQLSAPALAYVVGGTHGLALYLVLWVLPM